MSIPQQINFIRNLEEDDGARMSLSFVSEKRQKSYLKPVLDPLIVIE